MYTPPKFKENDPGTIRAVIRGAGLATLVTATTDGIQATPLPLLFDEGEGPHGVLLGHVSKANRQWLAPMGDGLAMFSGPDAYVTPSWYSTKEETGKVVPTWNYVAVHAYGPVEFFDEEGRVRDVVSRLTSLHESGRAEPWSVADAPKAYIRSQLKGIVGVKLTITRLEGKRKMGQDESAEDRMGAARGLAASDKATDRAVAPLIPTNRR